MTKTTFILLLFGFFCSSVSGEAEDVYFASGDAIWKYDLDQSSKSTVVSGLNHAVSLDFDIVDDLLFFGDVDLNGIYKAELSSSGNAPQKIATASSPEGLAVDWVLKNVYWTDEDARKVMVSNYDGSGLTTLIDTEITTPRAIALYLADGYMFWTDCGINPKIERASMDGSSRTIIVTNDIIWPNGLTIDTSTKRIYWIDGNLQRIDSANFDGSDVQNIISPGHHYFNQPFSLVIVGINIYFTDWGTTSSLKRMPMSGSSSETLHDQDTYVNGLKVYEPSAQIRDTTQEVLAYMCQSCSSNQLCLSSVHVDNCITVTCTCADDHVPCTSNNYTLCGDDITIPTTSTTQSTGSTIQSSSDKEDGGIQDSVLTGLMVACALCGALFVGLAVMCAKQRVCKRNRFRNVNQQPRDQPPPYHVATAVSVNIPQHYPGVTDQFVNNSRVNGRDSFNYDRQGKQPISHIEFNK